MSKINVSKFNFKLLPLEIQNKISEFHINRTYEKTYTLYNFLQRVCCLYTEKYKNYTIDQLFLFLLKQGIKINITFKLYRKQYNLYDKKTIADFLYIAIYKQASSAEKRQYYINLYYDDLDSYDGYY